MSDRITHLTTLKNFTASLLALATIPTEIEKYTKLLNCISAELDTLKFQQLTKDFETIVFNSFPQEFPQEITND